MAEYQFELLKVARMYYLENMTQQEIAAELKMSRSTVSRWLTRSRQQELVRISLTYPYATDDQLGEEVRSAFGLREAVVVMGRNGSEEELPALLGSFAAFYLQTVISTGYSLGLSWGTTLMEMVNSLTTREPLNGRVVQLAGGLPDAPHQLQANALVQQVSARLGGQAVYLHAPAVVSNEELASSLLADTTIRAVLDLGRRVDLAVVGIGTCGRAGSLTQMGLFAAEEMQAIADLGAVGEICARFYDSQGRPISTPFTTRTISLSLAELEEIPNLIAVAGGEEKIPALLGALRGGYIDTLITDEHTARYLRNVN